LPPLRFLHVFGTFDHGGAEGRTVALMDRLGAGIQHTVLVSDQKAMGARRALAPGVAATFPVEGSELVSGGPTPARLRRLAGLMTDADLVLTYSWGAMDFVLAHRLFARSMKLPALVHHEDGIDPPLRGIKLWLRLNYRRLAMRGADRIVIPSRTLAAVAKRRWWVPDRQLSYIPNGIEMERPGSAPGAAAQSHLRGRHETVVITVAGMRPEKNLPRLVRAAAQAGEDIRLVILGEGPERAAIAAEAKRLGIEHRVEMPGFAQNVREHLRQADIFALSSNTEQCPLSLIEAMAAGLPAVTTDVGDIANMVPAANRPFIVPADEEGKFAAAIRTLADDPALRRRLGEANAAHARGEFDSRDMVDAYRRLYVDLSAGSRIDAPA
jgi:glycosyltransferase involved in cell wall biosynthesis